MNKWLILTADIIQSVGPADAPAGSEGRPVSDWFCLTGAVGQRWVSPGVLSAACEVCLSVGPLGCSSLIVPPPTAAVCESACPSLDSCQTLLALI